MTVAFMNRETPTNNLELITPLIMTYNEEDNLERTLQCLRSFAEVVVLDSGSTDKTKEIAYGFPNVRFFTRPFDNFRDQWNYGHSLTANKWILSLDADYQVTPDLLKEITSVELQDSAYQAKFLYSVFGKSIRGTILPPRVILYDKEKNTYVQDGHTQRLHVTSPVLTLVHPIIHDDRKPLARWLQSQQRYAAEEVTKLTAPGMEVTGVDKLRMNTWVMPLLVFWYTLIIRGAILSGRRGLFYAFQRMYAELLFLLKRIDHSFTSKDK